MKWFDNPKTLEELKKQYKALALKHHPDRGGNLKDINEKFENRSVDITASDMEFINNSLKRYKNGNEYAQVFPEYSLRQGY